MSHRLDPLDRRLLKLSCPGVSMIKSPGKFTSVGKKSLHLATYYFSFYCGNKVAPICCVIPPASPSWTLVLLILSRRVVLPVSTWPRITQTGLLYYPGLFEKYILSSLSSFDSSFFFFSSLKTCWTSSSVTSYSSLFIIYWFIYSCFLCSSYLTLSLFLT